MRKGLHNYTSPPKKLDSTSFVSQVAATEAECARILAEYREKHPDLKVVYDEILLTEKPNDQK